jgi:hypothetical protein
MKRALLAAALALGLSLPAHGQYRVVNQCGSVAPFGSQPAGGLAYPTIDANGNVCISSSQSQLTTFALALPMALPSSGTVGANGALTLTTALDFVYPSIFLYMPAGAITSGSAAGFYYAQCTTTTACKLFNSTYQQGQTTPPASPPAFSGTTGIAYTQTTGVNLSVSLPNLPTLGPNDGVRFTLSATYLNSSTVKVVGVNFGANSFNVSQSTSHQWSGMCGWRNRGVTNSQISDCSLQALAYYSVTNGAPLVMALDTTQPQPMSATLQLATAATDYAVLQTLTLTKVPSQ